MALRAAQVRKRQNLFLDAFVKTGTILGACRRTGLSRETVRQWRLNDADFERRFQDTELDITETLETKGMSMAMNGDTTMVIFFLKARNPEKYRDSAKFSAQLGKDGQITEFTLNLGDGAKAG